MTDRLLAHIVSAALALLLTIVAVPAAYAQASGDDASEMTVASPDVILHVEGLACQMCARSLTNTLMKVDGIAAVQVMLEEEQRVLLALTPEARVDAPTLREAVERAGFVTRRVVFATDDESP